jgi:soluble lytic murein transglycosylase
MPLLPRNRPVPALSLLLAGSCLGSFAVLLLGRPLLERLQPPLNPAQPAMRLQRTWQLDPDPQRRREAALLLDARAAESGADPGERQRWLRHQGWGHDPLAALVLKRQAQLAAQLGEPAAADRHWRELLRRFPTNPASADALYSLGLRRPVLRRQLRERFPAHPAALAAAVEQGGAAEAVHLARWGERWPGAEALIARRCGEPAPLSSAERDQLAGALARLGRPEAARRCLAGSGGASGETALALARAQLREPGQTGAAEARLLDLARREPDSPAAAEAVRLLSDGEGAASLLALGRLPPALQNSAAVQARRALEEGSLPRIRSVLRRWPDDPASWELQWRQARKLALEGRWADSRAVLDQPDLRLRLPAALEARRLFWLGLASWELGRQQEAQRHWQELVDRLPGGYYGWRAAARLGRGDLDLAKAPSRSLPAADWHPLGSDDPSLERLWRLGQSEEVWEHWRLRQGGRSPATPRELLLEGRLRRAVGDDWLGLGQLEQASLRLPGADCRLGAELERELHRPAYRDELTAASRAAGVPAPLLAAVAKQESRFSAGVRSAAGAVGLLQLMPATASEVAGRVVTPARLEEPGPNAELGARYLQGLLQRWQGDPLLAVASYNAGPGAVESWLHPRLQSQPELWVEAIPYPETRLYVKKVLGNLWSMTQPRPPTCPTAIR